MPKLPPKPPNVRRRHARPPEDPIRVIVDLPPVIHALFLATCKHTGRGGAEVMSDALRAFFVVQPGDLRARLHEAVDLAFGEARTLDALGPDALLVVEEVIGRVLGALRGVDAGMGHG